MKSAIIALSMSLALGAVPCIAAEPQKSEAQDPAVPAPAQPKSESIDQLFARLAAAKDESEAKGIAATIERRWMKSGSDTADLLMSRALEAMQDDQPLAIEILDRVIALQPDWTEAWNKRATAFYMMGDHTRAMLDIREVLAREPRHFGALSGLGLILQAAGDKKHAYAAYKKALAVHPYLERLKSVLDDLEPEIEGRDI